MSQTSSYSSLSQVREFLLGETTAQLIPWQPRERQAIHQWKMIASDDASSYQSKKYQQQQLQSQQENKSTPCPVRAATLQRLMQEYNILTGAYQQTSLTDSQQYYYQYQSSPTLSASNALESPSSPSNTSGAPISTSGTQWPIVLFVTVVFVAMLLVVACAFYRNKKYQQYQTKAPSSRRRVSFHLD